MGGELFFYLGIGEEVLFGGNAIVWGWRAVLLGGGYGVGVG